MLRTTVEQEVRALVGTPWRHQGRKEGSGLDCIGVLIRVWEKTNYFEATNQDASIVDKYYKGYYALNPSDMVLVETLRLVMDEIDPKDACEGDLLVLRMVGVKFPKHLGILVKGEREMMMVHTLGGANVLKVVEEPVRRWQKLVTHAFKFRNIED